MGNSDFEKLAVELVVNYFNEHVDKTDNVQITEKDVFVVWLSKALQNNKATVSTTVPDGKYYEVTYNGDKQEVYLDVYVKLENQCIKLNKEDN